MTTYIVFVLDETGSMFSIKDDTIGGFNSYIDNLSKELEGVRFSLLKFNAGGLKWVYEEKNLSDVEPLSEKNYNPNNSTPLWDAFGTAIQWMERRDIGAEDKVIITVLTDGFENASREFNTEQVKEMIEAHPDWAINFLGANMDAWDDVGYSIGMSRGSTFTYDANDMQGTFSVNSVRTIAFAKGETTVDTFYEDENSTAKYENFDSEPE